MFNLAELVGRPSTRCVIGADGHDPLRDTERACTGEEDELIL